MRMTRKGYRSKDEIIHKGKTLNQILHEHKTWCRSRTKGIIGDLEGADLSRADLRHLDLRQIRGNHANLTESDLSWANLSGARLRYANLTRVNFIAAKLRMVDLRDSNLTEAQLGLVELVGVDLRGADLCNAEIGLSVFANCNLSNVSGLESISHGGPSSIGIDTILKSQGKIPEAFLKGAGVPDIWITYAKSLVENPFEFYSCFISYSHHDEELVEHLHTQLQAMSVRCWYFPEDATWGNKVQREIGAGVRLFDKVVVVCSEQSLNSGPVIDEIERALQREDNEKRDVLFPIRIDNYLFGDWANNEWEDAYKSRLTSKVIGSFDDWKNHDAFKKNFDKLLKALNRKQT